MAVEKKTLIYGGMILKDDDGQTCRDYDLEEDGTFPVYMLDGDCELKGDGTFPVYMLESLDEYERM
ncbi:hypothetical protein OROMI_021086 [Orobanche minor]